MADRPGPLLRQWSEALLARLDAWDRPVEPVARTGSLLRPPADEADVVAAQERLGVRLPSSYREFLLVSDGAYGDTTGALLAGGYRAGDLEVGFLPVSEVRPFVEVAPDTVRIWVEMQDEFDAAVAGSDAPSYEGCDVWDHRPMADGLLISTTFDTNCSLLVPVGDPGEGDEWEVWQRYKEGATRWSSFGAYLRDTVEEHLGVEADIAEVERLLAVAAAGDGEARRRLSRVRSPEAKHLLLDAARQGVAAHAVVPALGRIGGSDVVAALATLSDDARLRDHVLMTLARMGTPEALDVVASAGDFWQLGRVGDPRAVAMARERLHDGDVATVHRAEHLLRLVD